MEEGTGRICAGEGRVGVWYAFRDDSPEGRQWPSPLPPGTPIETSAIPDGRAGSRRGMHTYGTAVGWGAGIGLDLSFDGKTYQRYDASRYQGVRFWARGSAAGGHLRFRVSTASTTASEFGGTCPSSNESVECYAGPTAVLVPLGPDWQEYTVSFEKLDHVEERDRLTNIQFMAGGDFDFWVDDVSFVEGRLSCCPNLPECRGGVPLTDPAVRSALLKVNDSAVPLDCGDACGLRSVTLADPAIRSLDGFQCLGALESLSIEESSVVDLAPLSDLTGLLVLGVQRSRVNSIAPLQGLVQLQYLNLTGNSLTEIAPLEGLTALQTLDLGSNQIRDTDPIQRLSALQRLNLSNNRIDHLGEGWRFPALRELALSHNQLTDVGALAGLTSLSALNLSHNRISDVSALAGLTGLAALHLSNNTITTLTGAFAFRWLTRLDLSDNGLRLIPESALVGSTLSEALLARNNLIELNAFEHVAFKPAKIGSSGRNFGGEQISSLLDVSDNQVQGLAPLLRAGWQEVAIRVAGNPIECASEGSTITSLRARRNSVDVCP
jgi:Leucine-rich repeat (LRR) protein